MNFSRLAKVRGAVIAWCRAKDWSAISREIMRDIFVFGGLAAVWYGLQMFSPGAAWTTVGVAAFYLGKWG